MFVYRYEAKNTTPQPNGQVGSAVSDSETNFSTQVIQSMSPGRFLDLQIKTIHGTRHLSSGNFCQSLSDMVTDIIFNFDIL